MSNVSDLVFRYFEKVLVGLFGLALLTSVVLYGPWTYSTDFDARLVEVVDKLEERPRIALDNIPSVPDYEEAYRLASAVPGQEPYEAPYFWDILPWDENLAILPPSELRPEPNRGLILIEWDYNTTQPRTEGIYEMLGIEIQRAVVHDDQPADSWQPGQAKVLTKSGTREYLLPQEIYQNNLKYARLVPTRERRVERQSTTGITVTDLLNAVVDGKLRLNQVPAIVQAGIRTGDFTTADLLNVRDLIRSLPAMMRELQAEARMERRGRGGESTAPTQPSGTGDPVRDMLRGMGYPGGGKWDQQMQPTAQDAGQPKASERVIRWGEMVQYYDGDVNPDSEYIYRMRFWGKDISKTPNEYTQSEWSSWEIPVSPKPDTDFNLVGGSVHLGRPWIVVRKWIPATSNWISMEYQVSLGEEIGRKELVQKTDPMGRPLRDSKGNLVTEEVDFSTQCVLLAFQSRPRVTSMGGPVPAGFGVDNPQTGGYPIVSELQIIYSDRKGDLKTKWQGAPGSS